MQVRAIATAAAALALAAPTAAATTSSISGTVVPDHARPGTPLAVHLGFRLDPENGAEPATLSRLVLLLPHGARQNASLFPVCTAATINAAKSPHVCPRGSRIGAGTARADVTAVDMFGVPATVTFFNGSRSGERITLWVQVVRPARVSMAIDTTMVKTRGRYGFKVTSALPDSLQEIAPGWFQQMRSFESTLDARRTVGGRVRGYLEATRCPASGRAPIAGTFFFRDGSNSSTQSWVTCRP